MDFFNGLSKLENVDYNFVFIPGKERETSRVKISVYNDEAFLLKSKFIESNLILIYVKLLRYLLKTKPNKVVIGGFPKYYFCLVLYKMFYKVRIICWWGGTNLLKKSDNQMQKIYRKLMARFLDGCVYYSEFAKEYMSGIRKSLNHEFVLGNNTRDSKQFYKKVSNFNATKADKFRILTVGSLNKRKNTILILKAISSIDKLNNRIELNIIGEGDQETVLRTYAKKNNLNVNFLGQIDSSEVYKFYAEADMFVHPSSFDRWPQVYNEAIISGIPTLISNKSEVYDEYIKKYENLVVFNANDFSELANKIEQIINDKILLNQLSDFALKTAFANDGKAKLNNFNEFILSV